MMGMIGFTVGLIGFLLHQLIEQISEFKWDTAQDFLKVGIYQWSWGGGGGGGGRGGGGGGGGDDGGGGGGCCIKFVCGDKFVVWLVEVVGLVQFVGCNKVCRWS